jgi:nucleotide-binding universal stress UspA family protein
MFNHVLLPLDGSSLAECGVPHAATLAKAFDARLTLLRVLERPYQNGCAQPVDPLDWRMCKVEVESYLDHLVAQFQQSGLQAESLLLEGDPAEHIVKLVRDRRFDLVVLSSHGRSGLSSWNHGSVIPKVVARSQTSVMIVRAYRESIARKAGLPFYKRIMVPLDGSKRVECVVPPALALARSCGSELILVHVVARPEMARPTFPTQEDLDLANRIVERNQEEIAKLFEQIKTRLDVSTSIRVVEGDHVAAKLHELAMQDEADLVMMSAHGYSGRTKWPYGSVTTTFIEYGAVPLLVVQDLPPGTVELSEAEAVAIEKKGH